MPNSKEEQPRPKLTPEEIRGIIGYPKEVAQELKKFSERMRREKYDPHPGKPLILGRQTRIRKAA